MMTKNEFMNYEASKVSEILSRSGMVTISEVLRSSILRTSTEWMR